MRHSQAVEMDGILLEQQKLIANIGCDPGVIRSAKHDKEVIIHLLSHLIPATTWCLGAVTTTVQMRAGMHGEGCSPDQVHQAGVWWTRSKQAGWVSSVSLPAMLKSITSKNSIKLLVSCVLSHTLHEISLNQVDHFVLFCFVLFCLIP